MRNDRVDARKRRRFGFKTAAKDFDSLGRALNLDRYSARIVANESREVLLQRETVNVRPEADALHHAAYFVPLTLQQHFARFWFWLRFVHQACASPRDPA